jgi:ribosomal protein S7
MLNSMPKVAFKEIRLGSQKKDIPISISEKKQVLISVETLLKTSKINKKVEFNKLVECIISSYKNKGIIIKNKQMKYRKAIINKMLLNVYKSNKLEREIKKYVSKKSNFKIFKNKTAL